MCSVTILIILIAISGECARSLSHHISVSVSCVHGYSYTVSPVENYFGRWRQRHFTHFTFVQSNSCKVIAVQHRRRYSFMKITYGYRWMKPILCDISSKKYLLHIVQFMLLQHQYYVAMDISGGFGCVKLQYISVILIWISATLAQGKA